MSVNHCCIPLDPFLLLAYLLCLLGVVICKLLGGELSREEREARSQSRGDYRYLRSATGASGEMANIVTADSHFLSKAFIIRLCVFSRPIGFQNGDYDDELMVYLAT